MNKFIIFAVFFLEIVCNINYEFDIYNKNIEILEEKVVFKSQEIPEDIYEKMLGKSIPLENKDDVDITMLSYLQVSYFGFDNKTHVGEIIVNAKIADEVLEIFKELYEIKYPIEKIKLIDEYDADDELSMSDNNTSCFCYRVISGTNRLSNHSKRDSNRYKSIV